MLILTIRKGFEALKCKFELLERDSKQLNANSNHSKGIWSIQLQIWTSRMGFEAFKSKFGSLVRDSKHSNRNSNHSKGTWKHSNPNLNNLKGIQMQILTIWKGFKAFKCKFKPFEKDSNPFQMVWIYIWMLWILFKWLEFAFESLSNCLNLDSNAFKSLLNGLNFYLNASNPLPKIRIWIWMLRIPFYWFKFAIEYFKSLLNG